jgi:chromosome partitioning protein
MRWKASIICPRAITAGVYMVRKAITPPALASPKRLLVSSPKGGAGKTTIATNLLVCAAQAGLRVMGVDFDPQGNLAKWAAKRPKTEVVAVPVRAGQLDSWRELIGITNNLELIVIDTPPGVEKQLGAIKALAETTDLMIVPTGIGSFDLETVIPWMKEVSLIAKEAAFCLNKVNRRTISFRKAQQKLTRAGRLCPIEIPHFDDIVSLTEFGLTVIDIKNAKGVDDIEAVWGFVGRELGLTRELAA